MIWVGRNACEPRLVDSLTSCRSCTVLAHHEYASGFVVHTTVIGLHFLLPKYRLCDSYHCEISTNLLIDTSLKQRVFTVQPQFTHPHASQPIARVDW